MNRNQPFEYHLVITDPGVRIAEFYGWLNKYVSKVINSSHRRWENLWSSQKASVIPMAADHPPGEGDPGEILVKILVTVFSSFVYSFDGDRSIKRGKVYSAPSPILLSFFSPSGVLAILPKQLR